LLAAASEVHVAEWRSTKTPGVYVAHRSGCPARTGGRCRCAPAWRGRRHNPLSGRPEWQKPVVTDRNEVLNWLAAGRAAGPQARLARAHPTFQAIGDAWLDGVLEGRIARRRGRSKPYSPTTLADYRRSYQHFLRPEFGPMVAEEISELEWQMWIDRLASEGLSRSRIASQVAVASAIYAWAITPTRRFVTRNPLRLVELPPNDERPRLRVAFAPEARDQLAALEPEDRVPYAIAFYAGLRRSEIDRLAWPEVLSRGAIAHRLLVVRAKSEAGTERRPPIGRPLREVLEQAWERQGRPRSGLVLERSVLSGKLATRATEAWEAAGLRRITLHECRHTYASLLMAAGYTLKELMEYMGHADLQMVNRYVKLLPQPGERDAAQRLDEYLRRAEDEEPGDR
jgi:integrase